MTRDIQPIFILPEGATKTSGKSAQRLNIEAAKLVADQVRTTLGPKGMDKMLVDNMGNVTITNDGVTILNEMNIEHPSAKMIVEIAKTQEAEVGDGTTTAVVLAGEFLKNAQDLLDQNVHPTIISKGYRLAADQSQKILEDMSEPVTIHDKELLKSLAMTAMTGKNADVAKEYLADLVVEAITDIAEDVDGKVVVDTDQIKIEKRVGAGVEDTELIQGIVIDKDRVHPSMPKRIRGAKIALIDAPVEIKDTETDAKISITDPAQMQAFLDQEEKMIKEKVEKILSTGANVVICQKGIDDIAQYMFAKRGVYAIRRVKRSDMEALAKATGAQLVNNLRELSAEDLGQAGIVEEQKVGDDALTMVRECQNPKSVTILVRGSTEHVADEVKRGLADAIGVLGASIKKGKVVGGAGAVEIALAKELRNFANTLIGKEQLAVLRFADAIEVIPRTLAESAGLDPIDKLAEMRAAHEKGMKWPAIDVFSGAIRDSWEDRIIEPLLVKVQAIKSASEVAVMILRIDDVIASGSESAPSMPPPGAGGMPMM